VPALRLFCLPIRIAFVDAVISGFGNPMEQDRQKLAERLRNGDPETLDGLIEVYQHRLFRYLMSLTGNRPLSEDLFQETWIRVLERGHQYRPDWKFEIWLFSIARHLAIDFSRQKKGASLDELMDPEEGTGFEPPADEPTPFDRTLAEEEATRMTRLLDQIPAVYREVLTLRFREDLALDEIAAVIRAPLPTAKSRLYRGLEGLRKLIEGGIA